MIEFNMSIEGVTTDGLFAVSYKKDLMSDPHKRNALAGNLFAVAYKKDILDSTNPAPRPEERRVAPAGLFAVSYKKDIIPREA